MIATVTRLPGRASGRAAALASSRASAQPGRRRARLRRHLAAGGIGCRRAHAAGIRGVLIGDCLRLAGRPSARPWSQSAVTGLVVDLGGLWEPMTLRDRLARALGDPSLSSATGSANRLRRRTRTAASLPGPDAERAVTRVETDGEPVAVLVHDRTVLEDPALVEAVAAATRLAVANVRLQAEVHARAEQLAASRRRIVEAADAQRRRLQRELTRAPSSDCPRCPPTSRRSRRPSTEPRSAAAAPTSRHSCTPPARSCASSRAASIRRRSPTGGLGAALPELAARAEPPGRAARGRGRCPAAGRGGRLLRVRGGADERREVRARLAVSIEVRRDSAA